MISAGLKFRCGPRVKTIVHVGAHFGEEVLIYNQFCPEKVIWVEADPELFVVMKKNVAHHASGPTQHVFVNALVTAQDGVTHKFYRYSLTAANSIRQANNKMREFFPDFQKSGMEIDLISTSLKTLLNRLELKAEDVTALILDTEGCDLDCLKGAGEYLLAPEFIQIEGVTEEILDGMPLFNEIDTFMVANGFVRITELYHWVSDVVYANPRKTRVANGRHFQSWDMNNA